MKYLEQKWNYLIEKLENPVFPFRPFNIFPTGDLIDKATLGAGGLPYFKIIAEDEEIGPLIKDIKKYGEFCSKQKDTTECAKIMIKKQKAIQKIMTRKGLLLNNDVSDCFWENISSLLSKGNNNDE